MLASNSHLHDIVPAFSSHQGCLDDGLVLADSLPLNTGCVPFCFDHVALALLAGQCTQFCRFNYSCLRIHVPVLKSAHPHHVETG